jgi:hypothetical protein
MHQLQDIAERVAHEGGPAVVWPVGPDAQVNYGSGRNPFHGMTITNWAAE